MIIAMQALSTNVVNTSAQNALGVAILNLFHNQTNLYNARSYRSHLKDLCSHFLGFLQVRSLKIAKRVGEEDFR